MDTFRVRLNCVDHYQAVPFELDPDLPRINGNPQQNTRPRVPVIRVFGATETGQKVCAHIHGAFPYLYIQYNGSLIPDDVEAYMHQLHLSIDHALAVSYRRNIYDGKIAFAAHISLVKGVPFYGYHVGYDFFLKIYMLNPLHMTRLADLLRQGTIMKKVIQPYESHMQYLLQWMCDYNLYGCAYIDCKEVKFRSPVPDFSYTKSTTHRWHARSIPSSLIFDVDSVPRQSHCSIEVDLRVEHILNRHHVKSRPLHNDFIERKNPMPSDTKLVQSMAGLWRDETRRRKLRMGQIDSDSSPFPPEVLISMSADPRTSQPGGWIHESEYMEKIGGIIREEKDKSDGKKVNFDGFVSRNPLEGHVKTALESVEDLFLENLACLATARRASQEDLIKTNGIQNQAPEVDEKRVLSFEEDDFPYDSDEDLARELEMTQRKKGDHDEERLKQFANEGMNEPMCDLEPKSDSRGTIKHHQNIEELTSVGGLQCPANSEELAALGIRYAGDYSHIEDDAFEIPSEFASEIMADARKAFETNTEPPLKKRRILHDEGGTNIDLFEDRPKTRDSSNHPSLINRPSKDTRIKELDWGWRMGLLQPNDSHRIPEVNKRKVSTPSSSQETGFTQDGNRRLSFPIIKDPHDPNTILKLSQKSISPLKSSQGSKTKSMSFQTPSDPRSLPSSQYRSASLRLRSVPKAPSQWIAQSSVYIHQTFNIQNNQRVLCFAHGPPTACDTMPGTRDTKMPSVIYQDAYYSDEKDVPERAREYAGKDFKIESSTLPYLPDFDPTGTSPATFGEKPNVVIDKFLEEKAHHRRRRACGLRTWEFEQVPPTRLDVQQWLEDDKEIHAQPAHHAIAEEHDLPSAKNILSQIDIATQRNRHGFKYSQKQKSTSVQHETQYMSIMSLEIHVNTRGKLVPNPEQDQIRCAFWCLQSDKEELEVNGINDGTHVGVLALSEEGGLAHKISQQTTAEVEEESSELDLINRMVDIVRGYDPDILTGYEVHGGSWGYMIERARCKYDYNLCDEFSRMKSQSHGRFGKEDDRWGFNHTSTIRVTGRHMINIWRAMRGELNLLQYTMENVVFQLCHRRIPHYTFQDLTAWYNNGAPKDLAKVLSYYISRVQLDLEILEQNELVPRTSEQARLLGVDFFSVFSRGSQFKVESLMFRIAKPENMILPSPSRKQVGQQNALECLPLVMEPQSAFYNSPLLVLDFQSLYPSVMIAYNYCYSTFLGRVVNWRGQNKMGFTDYHREPRLLELLKDQVNIAPNGMMYAKPEIRKSLLAKMLGEILETRVMVKSGMKVDKDDKTLQRLLNNRQLALKLIANVTYGYTSASFSGRMPCSEIADSIVQTGRETLEKAIALIHSVERWGAEVVYGDTDSLFIYLKGRTKDESFDIGQDIAKTITNMNPRPVKLKFEKVYFPCVLLAKKRYVGFKYESKLQITPDFDAKGIETVRRDGTPAEQKIEEKALKILFRTADLSQVKRYFQKQCTKIMKGKVSIQDFCFAKEVKLGTYSDRGLPPPGALISTKRMLADPRAEPQYGERVPYVVITGAPGARLIDRCVAPDVSLHDDNSELDAEYYISKNLIPPLERIFNLVGANVRQWYDEMPKFQRIRRIEAASLTTAGKDVAISRKTMESYMKSSSCLVCREKLEEELAICGRCTQHADTSLLTLRSKLNKAAQKAADLERVCRSCAGLGWAEDVECDSKDCPVFYTRIRHVVGLRSTRMIMEPAMGVLQDLEARGLDW